MSLVILVNLDILLNSGESGKSDDFDKSEVIFRN